MFFGSRVVVVEYIFLLPGKLAASIRAQAARLFVRYLSGDEALYDEVANLKHVQDYLREADPTNWRTIFAEGAREKTDSGHASGPHKNPFTLSTGA